MKKRAFAAILSLMLMLPLVFSGCTGSSGDLMAGIKARPLSDSIDLTGDSLTGIVDFAVSLFQSSFSPDENSLISPLSVLCALAMTANGARGETLAQMECTFNLSMPELNAYLGAYLKRLPSGEKYKVGLADSIWFKDDASLKVEKDFLQTNADYYDASIYEAAFDSTTLRDINAWVSDKTDGMIKNILNNIPDQAIMYLINALAFDAEWEDIYKADQIRDGTFTTESGEERDAEMMYCSEYSYLNDGNATGFIKYYADCKYGFAALLPNEGVSVEDYTASLTGEGLLETLDNAQGVEVRTAVPKFACEYSVEMSDILKAMGMRDAFESNKADFSDIGKSDNGNIYIGRVIHKTFINLDEKGTKAGAATIVEIKQDSAPIQQEEPKIVYLDRPFVYMIVDCETNMPIFIGTAMDIGN